MNDKYEKSRNKSKNLEKSKRNEIKKNTDTSKLNEVKIKDKSYPRKWCNNF